MIWTRDDARQQYNLSGWSAGYFDVGEAGQLLALPAGIQDSPAVDLHSLAQELRDCGLSWPVLVRFTDILHRQVDRLCGAFDAAISATQYGAGYTAVYPIKVNQQQHVVNAIVQHGGERVGLEAGSKPELLAIIGIAPSDGVIICNGYKDAEYIRLALQAQRLGHRVTLVIEKLSELELIIRIAEELQLQPRLGLRVRLSAATAGNWQNTGGDRSKFGFTAAGVFQLLERVRASGLQDCLQLLHCHPGSQVSSLADLRRALTEVARTWVELRAAGVPIDSVDVGGGVGVDYEGTASNSSCSIDYSLEDYARTVVEVFAVICREQQLPAPSLLSESGRLLTAHHAVLLTNVIDSEQVAGSLPVDPAGTEPQLQRLRVAMEQCDAGSACAAYHSATESLAELRTAFIEGHLSLALRAQGESIYYALCRKLQALLQQLPEPPVELDRINRLLADKYFCNLSMFQSMPDVWGIDQVFPIVPLQRLLERPQRRATLHDLTCDSDGHIEHYVDAAGVESSLPVHTLQPGEPYLLGFFLLGAYQEILGDMHNLFGDTDAVNLELTTEGGYRLIDPHHGDSVDELLRYVEFEPKRLIARYREKVRAAGLEGKDRAACLQVLEGGLSGTTYLEEE
jgi:arginine decarboxylase